MAKRLIFIIDDNKLIEKELEFTYFNGFSISQKQKSIISLHKEIKKRYKGNILEISSKSPNRLGVNLSAFNLKVKFNNNVVSVENIFQSSKVFEQGGPYKDLLMVSPIEAKKDERIRDSGKLTKFKLNNKIYSNTPVTAFYDWIYCCAIFKNKELADQILGYDIFTDIEFNHEKSYNCQARSAGIFVILSRLGKLNVLSNYDEFIKNVYKKICIKETN